MRRRFVIAAQGLTSEQETKLREYLASHGAWWHWISNFWLLTGTDIKVTTADIRNHIKSLNADVRTVVFEFPEDTDWASLGKKNDAGKDMTDWIKNTWGKRD